MNKPEKRWVEWSPDSAPHVKGRYESDREIGPSGMPDPQQVIAVCAVCKARCKSSLHRLSAAAAISGACLQQHGRSA